MVNKFLHGKGALITGAASGFGKAVALAFAKREANLILVDVNKELLEKASDEIKTQTDQKIIPICCDVSNSKQVKELGKKAFNELDNIYILFNNAGIGAAYGRNIVRVKERDYDNIMNVNLKGQWLVAKALWRKMKKQNFKPFAGKMINTASIAGMEVNAKLPAYSLSKAGVIALTKLLAKTLAPEIAVNSIAPGYHVTGIYLNSEDDMKLTMRDGNVKTPLSRIGTVEDVIKVVLFLASEDSNFITGHNFPIDGGIAEVGVSAHYLDSDI
ncbi:MAG: 3-oxoacyl-[acyl-carrier-protein] reductase FabG [Promethearchaeota archaeon]|nr:MAG: 3-oxoacyl-[acyl-carrier-protein] reductase FabG [Candidatus Lokiarchaeota archaeon]